jgi:hypothetical protein
MLVEDHHIHSGIILHPVLEVLVAKVALVMMLQSLDNLGAL